MVSYAALDKDGKLIPGLSRDPHYIQDPASTTKLWTLYTLVDMHHDKPGGWKKFYSEHESDVNRMMIRSDNEAAKRLAVAAGGSYEGFAKEMNQRAYRAGAVNTNFVTPDGMNRDSHFTTAYDMARMMYTFRKEYPQEIAIAGQASRDVGTGRHPQTIYNTGYKMLQSDDIVYAKTGTAAGSNGDNGITGKKAGVCSTTNGGSICVLGVSGVLGSAERDKFAIGLAHSTEQVLAAREKAAGKGEKLGEEQEKALAAASVKAAKLPEAGRFHKAGDTGLSSGSVMNPELIAERAVQRGWNKGKTEAAPQIAATNAPDGKTTVEPITPQATPQVAKVTEPKPEQKATEKSAPTQGQERHVADAGRKTGDSVGNNLAGTKLPQKVIDKTDNKHADKLTREFIAQLQEALGVRKTGHFGTQTEEAVKDFQRRHNKDSDHKLAVDGRVGEKTFNEMQSAKPTELRTSHKYAEAKTAAKEHKPS